jgi:hypothetical protein
MLPPETAEYIDVHIADGVTDVEVIIENVVERDGYQLSDGECQALRVAAEAHLRARLAEHLEEQRTWPPVTDCDRLDEAFRLLRQSGMVAVPHIRGREEVDDALMIAQRSVRGAAFYGIEGVHAALQSGRLSVYVYAPDCTRETTRELSEAAVAALKKAGLDASWDGDLFQDVEVRLTWLRRR